MEQAYETVKNLVEDFGAHERDYLSPTYQKSHVSEDLIDKFFAALGWDVTHERQTNTDPFPDLRDVDLLAERAQWHGNERQDNWFFVRAPKFLRHHGHCPGNKYRVKLADRRRGA